MAKRTKGRKPKIVLFDIEATGLVANFGRMLSFAWKSLGDKNVKSQTLATFAARFRKDPTDDSELVRTAVKVLTDADMVVSWYGKRFDVPFIQTRALFHNTRGASVRNPIRFIPPVAHIDGWETARPKLRLNSNRLESVAEFLGVNSKTRLDPPLWQAAAAGNRGALRYVREHNIEDVVTLEKVYEYIKPLVSGHPNVNIITGGRVNCPVCGGARLEKRGYRPARVRRTPRLRCLECGAWSVGASERIEGIEVK